MDEEGVALKAVVLVGGEGTRMRPLTETIPKPLIPFMNRPFLHHVLDHLGQHGVTEAILSSPYLEEEFRSFLDERTGRPAVTWVSEKEPLGTSGAVAGALHLIDETFLVLNGDVLTDLDLTSLVAFHHSRGAVGTIALAPVEDARPYGLVDVDDLGRVLAFREKPPEPVAGSINAGTYVLEPEALDRVPRGVSVSIERETFPDLIERRKPLYGFVAEAYWRDLGTPAAYLAAHADALRGLIGGPFEAPLLGEGTLVDPTAAVSELVALGDGVSVAAGAKVDRSVLLSGASVDRDAEVVSSIVGPRAVIGEGAVVRETVLGAQARIARGAAAAEARVPPGSVFGG